MNDTGEFQDPLLAECGLSAIVPSLRALRGQAGVGLGFWWLKGDLGALIPRERGLGSVLCPLCCVSPVLHPQRFWLLFLLLAKHPWPVAAETSWDSSNPR